MYFKRFRRRSGYRRFGRSRRHFYISPRSRRRSSRKMPPPSPPYKYSETPKRTTEKQRMIARQWQQEHRNRKDTHLRGGNTNQTKEWEMIPPMAFGGKLARDAIELAPDLYEFGKDKVVGLAQEAAIQGLYAYQQLAPNHFRRNVVDRFPLTRMHDEF